MQVVLDDGALAESEAGIQAPDDCRVTPVDVLLEDHAAVGGETRGPVQQDDADRLFETDGPGFQCIDCRDHLLPVPVGVSLQQQAGKLVVVYPKSIAKGGIQLPPWMKK